MPEFTFNEFQKKMSDLGFSKEHIFIFTVIYERMMQQTQQIDTMAGLLNEMASSLQGFVQLREMDQDRLKELHNKVAGFGDTPGVSVKSVLPDPSDTEH